VKFKLILGGCAALLVLHGANALAAKPSTEKEKFSYALGFQIGQGFKRDNIDVDTQAMVEAINDVLGDKQPQLSMDEMRTAMEAAQRAVLAKRAEMANKAKADGAAFLAENKKKDGVKTLANGLQYKVLSSGKGKQPGSDSTITAHYQGSLINGRVFDSSYVRGEPATFNLQQVIKGWQEILPLMHEGDKWQVFIPAELGYGERGSGNNIGPNETLIFDIELIKVQ
jgi:FKBP-type peptidyl-prolyl cis-trans isomerase FklB